MQIPFRLVAVGLLLWNITFVTGQQKQHITSTMRYFCHFLQRSLPLHEVCVICCILLLIPAVVFAIARGVCHTLHTFAISCSGLCHCTRCVSCVAYFCRFLQRSLPLHEVCVTCSMLQNWRRNRTSWSTRSYWARASSMAALYNCCT